MLSWDSYMNGEAQDSEVVGDGVEKNNKYKTKKGNNGVGNGGTSGVNGGGVQIAPSTGDAEAPNKIDFSLNAPAPRKKTEPVNISDIFSSPGF